MVNPFSFAHTPHIVFGVDSFKQLHTHIKPYGSKILVVTGESSFRNSDSWEQLLLILDDNSINFDTVTVIQEPSPQLIDGVVKQFTHTQIDAIVAIGGGSVIDAGKAISAMLAVNDSVLE